MPQAMLSWRLCRLRHLNLVQHVRLCQPEATNPNSNPSEPLLLCHLRYPELLCLDRGDLRGRGVQLAHVEALRLQLPHLRLEGGHGPLEARLLKQIGSQEAYQGFLYCLRAGN